jgi:hypothetical protein
VLFSRNDVAEFINANFEPVWEMVRPVPIVRLDFGDGRVITRTLHGNIATYVCTAEGQVLDVLPGIYTPAVYLDRLGQFLLLARYVDQTGPAQRADRLRSYHETQAKALKANEPPARLGYNPQAFISKAAIERNLEIILSMGKAPGVITVPPAPEGADDKVPLAGRDDLANWKLLVEDTRLNETVRRRQIHERLASEPLASPDAVKKWLYKEVLHADLDDPYLGLGDALFGNYPFTKEDAK